MSFDTLEAIMADYYDLSQSLSSRAMSFDGLKMRTTNIANESQSLSSRAMSFDFKNDY